MVLVERFRGDYYVVLAIRRVTNMYVVLVVPTV